PPSAIFATALTAPSSACAVVINRPSAEIKKPLSVRNKFPLGSNVVTQITEGRTLASRFANSDDGVWLVFACGDGRTGATVGDCAVVVTDVVGCDCCASSDSLEIRLACPTITKAASQNAL